MNSGRRSNAPETVRIDLLPLKQQVQELTQQLEGDAEGLLGLLRLLEYLHREIQDGSFRKALPTDRQALYGLLRDMETAGGWPYIPRLQIRTFLELLEADQPSLKSENSDTKA
ncbi:hypothetical protein [Synechococcus elongatus]|uniref:Uncharacterized protein n=2 Tax=Synechococcus elongatus TaxID=32046 RepID=Q31RJ4_SYNE7|nr:hypothetical protein [Synechococcus elongatus]ABB56325.1 conserved hypothetical protein [Synechococcus elongatus PCC 7942 = FACHB-805]AJD56626.1 hypothetical protein M744_01550 [Synechococcus elongatus UTEX 2973]MBD2588158.1 hypothetical protein [Synechococcus elongatus FACHB-242]MBD2689226.1 hypothetical protein [Synechococcus elongatus FACHB-1061]MBD2707134.1 hypothetical protein [Synechococcus elongatus PCC 7942 = FACHB-805]